jgi:hypothetical protein
VRGTRGADKGVTLVDTGQGPSPIASWSRTAASASYANTIFFSGGVGAAGAGGGVVRQLTAQAQQYGERDVQDGNSTLGADKDLINKGAVKKLNQLADRSPTFTIALRQGFWRGRAHIDVGDTVRVVIRLGREVIDTRLRVGEINVEIDENDLESVTLTLGKLPPSADPRSRRAPIPRILRYLKNYVTPPGAADIPDSLED